MLTKSNRILMENWIEKEQPSIDDIKSLNETLKIPKYICSLLLQRNINSLEKAIDNKIIWERQR